MSASPLVMHEGGQEDGDAERPPKRPRLDADADSASSVAFESSSALNSASPSTLSSLPASQSLLPPSHALLDIASSYSGESEVTRRINELDVGISEYIAKDLPAIGGIIKQRFTDFLVYEVEQDSVVLRIKNLSLPESKKRRDVPDEPSLPSDSITPSTVEGMLTPEITPASTSLHAVADETVEQSDADTGVWTEDFTARLSNFLSIEKIGQIKQMFLEGPEPPFVSDSGWSGRGKDLDTGTTPTNSGEMDEKPGDETTKQRKEDQRGRGNRRKFREKPEARKDLRKVISDHIESKDTRTGLHKCIRELFKGRLDSETDTSTVNGSTVSRIVIKWLPKTGRGSRSGTHHTSRNEKAPRGSYPPYIHFTLQKTNRDTQDALAYLSRTLHVNVKDLSVAGTKDKRGVTVQRVALRRGNKSVEDVWRLANGVPSKRTVEEATVDRGERGIRIADLNYRKAPLELGMLKGNAFIITLRNVKADSSQIIDEAMNSLKTNGFINYYGMQRFGTASIPTHSIGLALLRSDWHRAISLILRERPGEHPDVVSARQAWLVEKNLDKALALMPRRVIAERCILENYQLQKGDTRNALGALSTIPRNLRLMYVHAYQSYVWNAIVSERIRRHGYKNPMPGDLVLVSKGGSDVKDIGSSNEEETYGGNAKGQKKPWSPPIVKVLTAEDVDNYSIFDVVMPLPGKDVAFPGGELGERYKEYLRLDGLDPDNFHRRQKEYSLSGSYRHILHKPNELSWDVMRYTDPDVALAQADEDAILGYDSPKSVPDGQFVALQMRLTLETAAYATMALREVTKADTSSHYQTELTQASEDQQFKGVSHPDQPDRALAD